MFPNYDPKRLEELDAQADAMLGVFGAKNYARVEPAILQPAEIFLDRSGEEIRRRTFVLTDPGGQELCLRPDLTIPVCRMFLDGGAKTPARLAYHGPAFRFQPGEPHRPAQFLQTGVECLGERKSDPADIEVLSLAVEALRAAGLKEFSVQIGDVSLFGGLIDALDVPPLWRGRLKRHFWRPDYFRELLARLSGNGPKATQAYLAHLGTLDEKDARAALEGLLDYLGARADRPTGGRTRGEIVDRLLEQAAEAAAVRLDKHSVALIERVLNVAGNARPSLAEIRKVLKGAKLDLGSVLEAMERRLAALEKLGLDENNMRFAARFGRNMEYYTGFVFELWARDAEGPVQIAGGGRYDTLLRILGAKSEIPAVGCAIRSERVLAARNVTSTRAQQRFLPPPAGDVASTRSVRADGGKKKRSIPPSPATAADAARPRGQHARSTPRSPGGRNRRRSMR
jgi:ATP phosphoribosyltransferase regulatory subunit